MTTVQKYHVYDAITSYPVLLKYRNETLHGIEERSLSDMQNGTSDCGA